MIQPLKNYGVQSCFLAFLISFCVVTNAQITKPLGKLYLQGGIGSASNNGVSGEISIQKIFRNKWVATLSYQNVVANPKNLPDDYQGEVIIIFPIDLTPTTTLDMFSITGGRYFAAGRNAWITTEAGITFGSGETLTFTPTEPQFYIIGVTSNYKHETRNKSLTGVMLRADFNWAFASFMGLGANVYANFNSVQSPVGFQLKLLVGKMGRAKKNKS